MWKRFSVAAGVALLLSALATATVWAAFVHSSYTGPTVIQNNNNGTWNLQWTITVTTLSNPDQRVCVSATTGATVLWAECGTSTGTLTCTLNNVPNTVAMTWDISSYAGTCASNSLKTPGPTGTLGPMAITLAEFYALQVDDSVRVSWETASELGNVGFNLYRTGSVGAGPEQGDLIATVPSQAPGSTLGAAYSYDDLALQAGQTYYYWLEDVDVSGATTLHGPVSVDFIGPTAVRLSGVSSGPAAASMPWLWAAAAGAALLGVSRLRRRG